MARRRRPARQEIDASIADLGDLTSNIGADRPDIAPPQPPGPSADLAAVGPPAPHPEVEAQLEGLAELVGDLDLGTPGPGEDTSPSDSHDVSNGDGGSEPAPGAESSEPEPEPESEPEPVTAAEPDEAAEPEAGNEPFPGAASDPSRESSRDSSETSLSTSAFTPLPRPDVVDEASSVRPLGFVALGESAAGKQAETADRPETADDNWQAPPGVDGPSPPGAPSPPESVAEPSPPVQPPDLAPGSRGWSAAAARAPLPPLAPPPRPRPSDITPEPGENDGDQTNRRSRRRRVVVAVLITTVILAAVLGIAIAVMSRAPTRSIPHPAPSAPPTSRPSPSVLVVTKLRTVATGTQAFQAPTLSTFPAGTSTIVLDVAYSGAGAGSPLGITLSRIVNPSQPVIPLVDTTYMLNPHGGQGEVAIEVASPSGPFAPGHYVISATNGAQPATSTSFDVAAPPPTPTPRRR